MSSHKEKFDHQKYYADRLASLWRKAPFVLRITEWKELQGPVLVIKERQEYTEKTDELQASLEMDGVQKKGALFERGHIAGEQQRRCLPILRKIVERVNDPTGVPLDLQRYLTQEGLKLQVTLPLDEECGAKLALIFRLQERVTQIDRVELIARRISRFTREEAGYWLSRTTSFGADANRWAIAGLRIMLGGQPGDPGVEKMLERLRQG